MIGPSVNFDSRSLRIQLLCLLVLEYKHNSDWFIFKQFNLWQTFYNVFVFLKFDHMYPISATIRKRFLEIGSVWIIKSVWVHWVISNVFINYTIDWLDTISSIFSLVHLKILPNYHFTLREWSFFTCIRNSATMRKRFLEIWSK